MGYFSFGAINFIYKIYRSKKFRKFVIGFGFLAFVLVTIFNNTTFAAQDDSTYTTDTTILILESYQRNVEDFTKVFYQKYGTNDSFTTQCNRYFNMLTQSTFPFFLHDVDSNIMNCYLYYYGNNNISSQVTTDVLVDGSNGSYLRVPCTGYNVTMGFNMTLNIANSTVGTFGANSSTKFIPSVLMWRMPSELVECMQSAGYLYNGPIVDIKQAINDMKATQEDIYNTINEEPDEEKANTDLQNMIPDTTTDITSGGFNTIFDTIRNEFINPTNNSVTITIPFTNKSFTISRNAIYGGLYNNIRNSVVGQLITSFWWFSLGYFIYMDIAHIINKVKSGNIEDIENTNIKEDLL